jgi:hypothetical protein
VQASYWDKAAARSHGKEAAGLHCVRGREGEIDRERERYEGEEDQGKWQTDGGGRRCLLACRLRWMSSQS